MTPLHRAVIEDNYLDLADKVLVDTWRAIPDQLGFTALEIAQFLGKNEAVKLLGGKFPDRLKLQPNGMRMPIEFSLEGFEKALRFQYRPFLTFSSYSFFKQIVHHCPYILRSRTLACDNYQWTQTYQQELKNGKMCAIDIKWIDTVWGYGAFAAEDLPKGTFVGEYTGHVRQLFRNHPDHNPYCFHYPTKFWSLKYLVVDSLNAGNLTRFINHSNHPNLQPICLVDRNLLHQVFISRCLIRQGEQLTFNYGEDYWAKRLKLDF